LFIDTCSLKDNSTIRNCFPVFQHHPELVYADNAATTQRPLSVIEAVADFEKHGVANIHRGMYTLAEEATQRFESTREKVARFLNAPDASCIAFTKGTTESITTVAFGFLRHQLNEGDEVIISAMEHHANLIPWQQVCKERKAKLVILPVTDTGELDMDHLPELFSARTKFLAITHISNTLGTINPIAAIIREAHRHDVPVLVDAAQSIAHYPMDVQTLAADFLVFSAHKMFGPFGVGVLYTHPMHHDRMRPLSYGGGGIRQVTFEETVWQEYPHRLEAGTQPVSGVVGLSSALDFIHTLPLDTLLPQLQQLRIRLEDGLRKEGFRIVGEAQEKSPMVSFVHDRIHPHDIATFLASNTIAVRAGHHCTQPLLDRLGIPATVRVSFSVYNTHEDVDRILEALRDMKTFW
jgi:cysteine desulfurase / selenocysteine lyase